MVMLEPNLFKSSSTASQNSQDSQREESPNSSPLSVRISQNEIELATGSFVGCEFLGSGQSGSVYKTKIKGTTVAIKRLKPGKKMKSFEREVSILNDLRHPHILLLMGYCPEIKCIVYEYMPGGSLKDRLECIQQGKGESFLHWSDRLRIAWEISSGLLYMHNQNVVHRDLKPANVLLDQHNVSKIADVGLAQLCDSSTVEAVVKGTPGYIDPDHLRNGVATRKSDVYALGLVLLQLLTGICEVSEVHTLLEACGGISDDRGGLDEAVAFFSKKLDSRAGRWAIGYANSVLRLALRCTERDPHLRPSLETDILPELEFVVEEAAIEMRDRRKSLNSLLVCPLSGMPMEDPVVAADGYTYERVYITRRMFKSNISPTTGQKMPSTTLVPNTALRKLKDMQDLPFMM